jgi:hypothetical protein
MVPFLQVSCEYSPNPLRLVLPKVGCIVSPILSNLLEKILVLPLHYPGRRDSVSYIIRPKCRDGINKSSLFARFTGRGNL